MSLRSGFLLARDRPEGPTRRIAVSAVRKVFSENGLSLTVRQFWRTVRRRRQ
jgi:hypothetical protein